jgi:hypothetical protein
MALVASTTNPGLRRASLGALIAGVGTAALTGYTWVSAHGAVPTPDVSAAMLALIGFGAAAGWVSGRYRAAVVSAGAAVIGSMLAYAITAALDPGLPEPDSGFTGHELTNVAFVVAVIAGGHALGAWAGSATWRSALGAVIAGLATGALLLYSWSNERDGVAWNPGIAISLALWVGIGVSAGLVSGRLRDAFGSWGLAVVGFLIVYGIHYGIPLGGAAPVEGLVYTPIALLLFVAGGHLFAALAADGALRLAGNKP